MTEQEAIKVLEKPSVHIKPVHKAENGMDFLTYSADLVETFEMSIKALEKQIPKKPTMVYPTIASCPICDEIICPHTEYCPDCGQKLDWGNEDAE